jgi:aromatic ring-cleaving dioxygenase
LPAIYVNVFIGVADYAWRGYEGDAALIDQRAGRLREGIGKRGGTDLGAVTPGIVGPHLRGRVRP